MPPAPTPAVYNELVAPSNAAIDRWNAAADRADLAAIRAISAELALLLTDFATAVAAQPWPEAAQAHAADLVAGLALEVDWYRAVAATADDEGTVVTLEQPWSDDAVEAAALLREALGGTVLP
ncbi:hypothetical protein [Actinotalea fermentans]|uniref:Uncharacterized protein n=1 Tax=Actinotalea fermentans TaxID=43671 RepID=A0A511YU55_9CELL|nr:hypothetical protein [Actinotalea fermentans]KGM17167.1 hypothetical protein N867_09170 [Actinotalea fermentans ATCC 43279 = JCM 9966 = DSM 3133]GEN78719.1 hypothetical protein AFE02nite_04530 [Actinotalea fermentans]